MANIILPSDLTQKVKTSIERIKAFDPSKDGERYYVAFSGGKDSVVVKALMDMADVPYEAVYRHTSVDPPELIRFIYDKHPDVTVEFPRYNDGVRITMWNLIPRKMMPPTQIARYCCEYLKESAGVGRLTVTGVRWAESVKRSKNHGFVTIMRGKKKETLGTSEITQQTNRGGVILNSDNDEACRMIETCYRKHKTILNPIVDWETSDVWKFIRSEKIPYCELYDCGFSRLGCVGCPMGSFRQKINDFNRWPAYKHNYLLAFDRMLAKHRERIDGNGSWKLGETPEQVFRWWIRDQNLSGQTSLFEEDDE